MGRPLKQKYFDPTEGSVTLGGEGVTATDGNVAVTFSNQGLGYYSANAAVTFSAPQLPGGTTATGSVYLFANGAIKAVGLTTAGTGYTTKPTLTFTGANTTPAAGTITGGGLTSAVTNVIALSAYIPTADGGSSAVVGDIVKQVGAKRFKVLTAQGTGKCKLVTTAPAAGECRITATDNGGGTYYVSKISGRTATLVQYGAGAWEFDDGAKVKWTLGSAVANDTVTISSN